MKTKLVSFLLLSAAFLFQLGNIKAQTGWTFGSPYIYSTVGTDRVGIGIATPAYGLQINNVISAGSIGGGNFAVGLNVNDAAAVGHDANKHAIYGNLNINKDILFATTTNGTSFDEWMRITYQGRVGIGTTTPGYKLDVRTVASTKASYFQTTGDWQAIDFSSDGGTTIGSLSATGAKLTIGSSSAGTNPNVTINLSTGNVGIGTTAPDITSNGSAYKTLSLLGPNTSANSCGILELATQSTDADANLAGVINFTASANASTKKSIAQITSWTQGTTSTNRGGYIGFSTKPDGSTSTVERMRIDNVGNVGIGLTSPGAKLDVTIGGSTSSYAIRGTSTSTGGTNYGGYFTSTGTSATANIGLFGGVAGGTSNYNLWLGSLSASANNYSLYSAASAKSYFAGNVGINTTTPGFTLDIAGSANCTSNTWTSDQQFKNNVDSLQNALEIIHQLKSKTYYFDTLNVYGFQFPASKQYGFIAQDIQQILPELVVTANKGTEYDDAGNIVHPGVTYKALNYIGFISILTKGVQELQQKNDSLKNELLISTTSLQDQLNQLQNTINSCCSINEERLGLNNTFQNNSFTNQSDVKLSDKSIVLEQNVPNPFAEQTTINYFLPDNMIKAQMLFYNVQGKLIQSIDLTQKGKGVLNVFANDLSNGIYTYTLVVDGKIIESKKMVKQ